MTRYPQKMSRRHYQVLKWLLDNPSMNLTECAAANGYSRSWLSRIVNSPAFRNLHKQYLESACKEAARNLLLGESARDDINNT